MNVGPALRLDDLAVDELIGRFDALDDWESRFMFLLDLGRQVPRLAEAERTDANQVDGCQSQVWLKSTITDDDPPRFEFVANSDAKIVTGLIAILMVIYNGRPAREVADHDPTPVLEALGLEEHLSPTRRNGLYAMLARIRGQAEQAM